MLTEMVNHSMPSQIAFKVACRYTMKSRYPLSEPAAIGINILNVVNIVDNALTCCHIDWTMNDFCFSGDLSVSGYSIRKPYTSPRPTEVSRSLSGIKHFDDQLVKITSNYNEIIGTAL